MIALVSICFQASIACCFTMGVAQMIDRPPGDQVHISLSRNPVPETHTITGQRQKTAMSKRLAGASEAARFASAGGEFRTDPKRQAIECWLNAPSSAVVFYGIDSGYASFTLHDGMGAGSRESFRLKKKAYHGFGRELFKSVSQFNFAETARVRVTRDDLERFSLPLHTQLKAGPYSLDEALEMWANCNSWHKSELAEVPTLVSETTFKMVCRVCYEDQWQTSRNVGEIPKTDIGYVNWKRTVFRCARELPKEDESTQIASEQPAFPEVAKGVGNGQKSKEFKHSNDYRSVIINGQSFTLTTQQAQVIQILHEAFENGTPSLSAEHILNRIGTTNHRLIDTFRSNRKAWKALV